VLLVASCDRCYAAWEVRSELSVALSRGADPCLERAEDLSVPMEALAGVRASGQGRLVLVAGEAGVGKTALIARFCELRPGSVRVSWGACEPLPGITGRPVCRAVR
jgi:hypothetical protein